MGFRWLKWNQDKFFHSSRASWCAGAIARVNFTVLFFCSFFATTFESNSDKIHLHDQVNYLLFGKLFGFAVPHSMIFSTDLHCILPSHMQSFCMKIMFKVGKIQIHVLSSNAGLSLQH